MGKLNRVHQIIVLQYFSYVGIRTSGSQKIIDEICRFLISDTSVLLTNCIFVITATMHQNSKQRYNHCIPYNIAGPSEEAETNDSYTN